MNMLLYRILATITPRLNLNLVNMYKIWLPGQHGNYKKVHMYTVVHDIYVWGDDRNGDSDDNDDDEAIGWWWYGCHTDQITDIELICVNELNAKEKNVSILFCWKCFPLCLYLWNYL